MHIRNAVIWQILLKLIQFMESVLLFLGREMEDSSATDEDSEDDQNGDMIEGKALL